MSTIKVTELVKTFNELTPEEKRFVLEQIGARPARAKRNTRRVIHIRNDACIALKPVSGANHTMVAPQSEHWGHELIALRDTLKLGDWSGVEDSVDYVQKLREEERQERLGDWGAGE